MSAKRKSRGAEPVDSPSSKRRKAAGGESAQGIQALGYQLLEIVKSARDKRNDLICAEFETLPEEEDVPDYYDIIKLPIAIDTIEDKLDRLQYPTLTTLESDFKRMVANAKTYNEKDSDIYGDAEKIRKMVATFMSKHNPAYSDPSYVPFPTPIPDEEDPQEKFDGGKIHLKVSTPPSKEGLNTNADITSQAEEASAPRGKRALTLNGPRTQSGIVQTRPTVIPTATMPSNTGFEGRSFQEAQEMIIQELLTYTDEEGVDLSGPFAVLPPRDLEDYYDIVEHPVCLKGVLKQVKGQIGHKKGTGVSLLKTWDAFETELNYIWDNARLYNDDDSEIFAAANELEAFFHVRVDQARAQTTGEAAQPRVTLRVPTRDAESSTRLKLHLSNRGAQGYNVDPGALQRQQDAVAAAARSGPRSRSRDTDHPASVAARGDLTPMAQTNGVKVETSLTQSPGVHNAIAVSSENALQAANGLPTTSEGAQSEEGLAQPREPPPPPPRDPLEARLRPADKGLDDALITSFEVATHPLLKSTRAFRLHVPASARLSQQSVSASLSESQNLLQVHSTFPASLFQRPHKIVARLNKETVPPIPAHEQDPDPCSRVFDLSLNRGAVNVLDLEVLVSLTPRGAPKVGNGTEYEYERITLYLNVFGQ